MSVTFKIALVAAAIVLVLPLGLVVLAVIVVDTAGTAAAVVAMQPAGGQLSPDAPVPPQYVQWINQAGSICAAVTPAALAAQIYVESGFEPQAYADAGEQPAYGIAQFTAAAWQTWGGDHDGDGSASPYDPPDAIVAMGTLMCDNVNWAADLVAAGELRGDLLDLAWAAYFAGRQAIVDFGGVPSANRAPLTHAYPGKVRDALARFAAGVTSPAFGRDDWALPLPRGHLVSSVFGDRCMTLADGSTRCRMHNGVDIPAAPGTPIYAVQAGIVVTSACDSPYCDRPGHPGLGGCGHYVKIDHGYGIGTMYCHLLRRGVVGAERVVAGQVIGWVGSTGDSTGPHLHFEVHYPIPPFDATTARDPVVFLRGVGLTIA